MLKFWLLLGVSTAFLQLRIVEHFQIINDLAAYDHPENIADLEAAMEEKRCPKCGNI